MMTDNRSQPASANIYDTTVRGQKVSLWEVDVVQSGPPRHTSAKVGALTRSGFLCAVAGTGLPPFPFPR